MSRTELTPFSYVILVLVGRGGASPHDFVRMMRQGRVYQSGAPSQYYAEPKRLERLGYLRARKEPGKTRERTHYTLTDKGVDALRAWMETPAAGIRVSADVVPRMLAADLIGEGPVRESLRGLREEIDELNRWLDIAEDVAQSLPHRRKYLLLNHKLAREIVRVYADWLDRVEEELDDNKA
jgi:DNA-binding PadR family transcriptional regulator